MSAILSIFQHVSLVQIFSAFIVMFAIIDINGSIPIIVQLKERNLKIKPGSVFIISFIVLMTFLFVGEGLLKLFNVDISSFAVAGSIIIFVLAAEMIFDIEVFKNKSPDGSATIVPLVFPLVAGPGTVTTMLSLRAEFHGINIVFAIILNLIYVYIVLKYVYLIKRLLGDGGIYILRKFFGIILLAMGVKLFFTNLMIIIH
ncbi:MAG: MarC family protein [Bacteroidales bacterium]|jgi:multiple antibiotic resistance protein